MKFFSEIQPDNEDPLSVFPVEKRLWDRDLLGIITPAALSCTIVTHDCQSDRERPLFGIGMCGIPGYRYLSIAKLPDP